MLAFIFNSELRAQDFLLVPNQIGHDLAVQSVYNPDHVVLAARHEHRRLVVPLDKVQILLRNVLDGLLECEAVLHVPHSQKVIHAASDEPLAG